VLASPAVFDLRWSWLCTPFVVCAVALAATALAAALLRGDRVVRLGLIGAGTSALPWAICSSLAACTDDAAVAVRFLRVGFAPVALVGPSLLLAVLGFAGRLERHRWVARLAGTSGAVQLLLCLGTDWTVPGVHRLSSGMYYLTAGALTDVHIAQLALWLAVALIIAWREIIGGARTIQILVAAFALAAVASSELLVAHGIVNAYSIAWLPATIACGLALHLELATDVLRPRGIDRGAAVELVGLAAASLAIAAVARVLASSSPAMIAVIASVAWTAIFAATRVTGRRIQPRRAAPADALERFVAGLTDIDDDKSIAERLAMLWQPASIAVRATWRSGRPDRAEPGKRPDHGAQIWLTEITTGAVWQIERDVCVWMARGREPLAAAELATMRPDAMRSKLEAVIAARGATLFVPLVDRGALVGLVEADHALALREPVRGMVVESARAAARALTYVDLARVAAREGVAARELEVAEAMRLQASASHDDELGAWLITAEHRTAARTTGAAWSASLLGDGRLAILVTEGESHGVVSALATAALTGAFAAATTAAASLGLDELLVTLRASAESVLRGGEPIAAFVAIVDASSAATVWGCAGHPGAHVVPGAGGRAPIPLGGGGATLGDALGVWMRGEAPFGPDMTLVIASNGVRGGLAGAWPDALRGHPGAGSQLAAVLVEAAGRTEPDDDLLAVVVRPRSAAP